MSDIIGLLEPVTPRRRQHHEDMFSRQVSVLLRHPDYQHASAIEQSPRKLEVCLPSSSGHFSRDLRVEISLELTHLRVSIKSLNSEGTDYMRAQSQRMKL